MINLSPIILFVYNRLDHTKQTIEALQKNSLAKDSELFIYSDYPKNDNVKKSVNDVRNYIDNIDGFKKITIIKRDKNLGLADSIIDGVTKIVNEYGKIIVMEDDLVTSPSFLKFMNDALDFYEKEDKVWHISGWNYPIKNDAKEDVFLWRTMNCWGWATWSNNWKYFEKNIDKAIGDFSKKNIKKFNIDGYHDFWSHVLANKNKKINTWAIFWYISIFRQKGLCLNPIRSFISNIGLDNSGVHCGKNDMLTHSSLNKSSNIKFDIKIEEDEMALKSIKSFFKSTKLSILDRIINKLQKIKGKHTK